MMTPPLQGCCEIKGIESTQRWQVFLSLLLLFNYYSFLFAPFPHQETTLDYFNLVYTNTDTMT